MNQEDAFAMVVKEAVAAERERCAKIAETQCFSSRKFSENPYDDVAAAIRQSK